MITAKKILIIQKVSLLCSVVAMVLSVIAIVSISTKCDINMKLIKENKSFKPIEKIPDVEIIHPDGRVESVKSMESNDKLGDIIAPKKVIEKKPAPVSRNNAKDEKNVKKDIKDKKGAEVKNDKNNQNNQVKNSNTQQVAKSQEKVAGITGNFVIQVGSFKEKKLAEIQCEKVIKTGKLKDKKCAISSSNNSFRSIIYPFNNRDNAVEFADKLQRENRISCLVKKNG